MPTKRSPRKGSLQYWPRKRAKRNRARVRSRVISKEKGLVGFGGYKVGMVHGMIIDNRPGSLTKGSVISMPITVIECPALRVYGVNFYKNAVLSSTFVSVKNTKELSRLIPVPKKTKRKIEDFKAEDYDDIRLIVYSQPRMTGIGKKKPEMFELALGGNIEEKFAFAKESIGKDINLKDVMKEGQLVDVHCITKGKGFQGTVKRFGVSIKSHKSEKTKRGVGNLGAWTPKHTSWRVPQPGKMGCHQRTEYNKWVLKISDRFEEINPKGGFLNYGIVKNPYLLIKGSVAGSRKSFVILTKAIRPNKKIPKEAPVIKRIVR